MKLMIQKKWGKYMDEEMKEIRKEKKTIILRLRRGFKARCTVM